LESLLFTVHSIRALPHDARCPNRIHEHVSCVLQFEGTGDLSLGPFRLPIAGIWQAFLLQELFDKKSNTRMRFRFDAGPLEDFRNTPAPTNSARMISHCQGGESPQFDRADENGNPTRGREEGPRGVVYIVWIASICGTISRQAQPVSIKTSAFNACNL
jgi:hypothetical protein